ncbi:hypothetical protein DPQ33_16360 [Oceanidesulfovibrio indonesiensis]|uniref:Uncharacterized protein n=1 Tax=Oceanidesulfovibrio indonesiensis TaxID=54767 RepID=A0A7M3MAV9_9BACT|nr:hypothetical protein DPQ33_16360 [Oceanidesulfovibrio indonesiensis]
MRGGLASGSVLPILLLLILLASGCAASTPTIPKPPRPILESLVATPDGGVCMGREDARELLLYIDTLERRP